MILYICWLLFKYFVTAITCFIMDITCFDTTITCFDTTITCFDMAIENIAIEMEMLESFYALYTQYDIASKYFVMAITLSCYGHNTDIRYTQS